MSLLRPLLLSIEYGYMLGIHWQIRYGLQRIVA